MKHNGFRRLTAVLLSFALLFSVGTVYAKNKSTVADKDFSIEDGKSFVKIENENGIQYYGVTGDVPVDETSESENQLTLKSKKDYKKANGRKDKVVHSVSAIEPEIDNSKSPYFPAIGNQGNLGSCTYWAQIYYQFTYTMNKSRGIETTPENTFSPQWAYNNIASTDDEVGAYYETYGFMKKQGNVYLSQVPYDLNKTSVYPTEEIWKTSIKNRIKGFQKLDNVGTKNNPITNPDDEDLDQIKKCLHNGEILAYSTCINSWKTVKVKSDSVSPENIKYSGQEAVTMQLGSSGPHRMTLVGYNDNLWIDVNENDLVDSGEMGAFKIANSWGSDYGNNGFMWIAYDALNEVSCVEGVEANSARKSIFSEISRIEVLEYGKDSDLYLKFTLNTSDRKQAKVTLIAEKDGTINTFNSYSNTNKGDSIAYDGTTDSTDATFIVLLSNAATDITSENLEEYSFIVSFSDTTDDTVPLTVKNAEIINESKNKSYTVSNTFPFTLNGEEKTVDFTKSSLNHAVIYYRGYYNPLINYKVGDGEYVSEDGLPMEKCTERPEYVHKYVIDLKDSNNATLYFINGDTNEKETVSYTAKKGLNYYITENASDPLTVNLSSDITSDVDIDNGCTFAGEATGGYAPYQYQFKVTNLETMEETLDEFDSYTTLTYFFRSEGKYEITLDVKDHSGNIVSKSVEVIVQDIPFSFKSLTKDTQTALVGKPVSFTAVTQNEKIRYTGKVNNDYTFTVKDQQGNVCYNNTKKCNSYNMNRRFTQTTESYIPAKSGNYTLTVSSTDANKEYAEKTISFTVYDMVIGDANGDGYVNVSDATTIQKYIAYLIGEEQINKDLANCDDIENINVKDATMIQRYLACLGETGNVGNVVEYIPPTEPPTETPTDAPTETPTTAPTQKNVVTFTNSLNWSGTISCYYWSDSSTTMTSWPGKTMTKAGVNEFTQTYYSIEVPQDATYIIFTNGSAQTVDIPYSGGEVKYYALDSKTGNGYNVKEW